MAEEQHLSQSEKVAGNPPVTGPAIWNEGEADEMLWSDDPPEGQTSRPQAWDDLVRGFEERAPAAQPKEWWAQMELAPAPCSLQSIVRGGGTNV